MALEILNEKVDGLPAFTNKSGRRYLQEGPVDRLMSRNTKSSYYVYLFTDVIVFAEKKRKGPHKYVAHKYLANCMFVDIATASKGLKYAFEIKSIDSKRSLTGGVSESGDKEEFIFLAKNLDVKNVWKRDLESNINHSMDEIGVVTNAGIPFGSCPSPVPESSSALSGSSLFSEENFSVSHSSSFRSEISTDGASSYGSMADSLWGSCNSELEETGEELDELEIGVDSEPAATATSEFLFEMVDKSQVVHAGSVNAVTWLLMFYDHTESSTIQAFLFAYKSFATPYELLDILYSIYMKNLPPKDLTLIYYSDVQIRKKVASFLRIWVAEFLRADFDEKLVYDRLLEFIDGIHQSTPDDANEIRLAILRAGKSRVNKKLSKKLPVRKNINMIFETTIKPNTPATIGRDAGAGLSLSRYSNKFNEFSLTAVAEHLANMEHSLYQSVALSELAKMAWKDVQNSQKNAPHILASTAKFNLISQWVSTELLSGDTPKQRALMIERFVSLASKCAEMNNFHTLMEILAGINRGYIDRLKKTWALVSKSSMETLESLNDLMDPKQNFKKYRDSLRKSTGPALPYLGIFLQDIVFAEEGNNDKTEGLMNCYKIQIMGRIYKEVLHYQKKKYPPCEDETIITYFKQLCTMPDELLYRNSREWEPSASALKASSVG